jgi:four helix bundle protein
MGVARVPHMGVKRVEELIAFQLARRFKRQVYAIVRKYPQAYNDFRYRGQLWEAASSGEANIDEGFQRFGAAEFKHFLGIARASLSEAKTRLLDGADRGYFPEDECTPIADLGERAIKTIVGLQRSLEPFIPTKGSAGNSRTPGKSRPDPSRTLSRGERSKGNAERESPHRPTATDETR